MSLMKRGGVWWADFTVDGQRFRVSLETGNWAEAERRHKSRIAEAKAGKLAAAVSEYGRLGVAAAAARLARDRAADPHLGLAQSTVRREAELFKAVARRWGSKPLRSIRPADIAAWQRERLAAGLSRREINMELIALRKVLKAAKRWHLLAADVHPLKETDPPPARVLTAAEKARLLATAAKNPQWEVAYLAAVITLNTTCRGGELKALRWENVNFLDGMLTVEVSKTAKGKRAIPLTQAATEAFRRLMQRARIFGPVQPRHFVFASMGRWANGFDPARPMLGWRTAWRSLTKAAGLPGLRFHDLRHQVITELAESQASDAVIMGLAGHVSRKMLEHYSHARLEAKRAALAALKGAELAPDLGQGPGSHVTIHGTMGDFAALRELQVIEEIGGDDGARTRDLRRDSFQVTNLNPFACLVFAHPLAITIGQKAGVLMAN